MPLRLAFFAPIAFLIALVAIAPCTLAANATISPLGELHLNSVIEYTEDPAHTHTFDSIQQPGVQWRHNDHNAFNRGYSNSSWWLKVRINNPRNEKQVQLLEIAYAILDHVDIYVAENGSIRESYAMGDKKPHFDRPSNHRFFVIPINWNPQQTLDIYLHIRTGSSVQVPLTLWSYERFYSVDTASTISQGFYYGGMLVIAAYNLLIYFVLRSRTYLFYVGFILSMPMFLGALSGQSFRYLWPTATSWNDIAIVFFLSCTCWFGTAFTYRFLRIDLLSAQLGRLLKIVAWISFSAGIAGFIAPYHTVIQVLVPLVMVSGVTNFAAGIYALLRRQPSARIYVIASSCFLVGALIMALNKLNVVPTTLLTEYAAQFGSMIEAILLSVALTERINHERRLRFEAQTETLQASQRMNQQLEQRVLQRTRELETLNNRLQELSDTDQLTRLKNRRALESRLAQEWARATRYRHQLALIMIDIDHFKAINDNHGHQAGDACLQQIAAMISGGLRWPSDLATRYGGEEFCLLLPETGADGARKVIERIRERIADALIETSTATFRVTISAGVFAAVPNQQFTAEAFIREADAALYQSKQAGRNRITLRGTQTDDAGLQTISPSPAP